MVGNAKEITPSRNSIFVITFVLQQVAILSLVLDFVRNQSFGENICWVSFVVHRRNTASQMWLQLPAELPEQEFQNPSDQSGIIQAECICRSWTIYFVAVFMRNSQNILFGK